MPKHPEVIVQLTNTDGNAFLILSAVRRAMREAGISESDIEAYVDKARSEDYDNLLRVTNQTVTVI